MIPEMEAPAFPGRSIAPEAQVDRRQPAVAIGVPLAAPLAGSLVGGLRQMIWLHRS
jgi:hypothetical protein